MDYNQANVKGQTKNNQKTNYLHVPTLIEKFRNTETAVSRTAAGREIYRFKGEMERDENDRVCSCGCRMRLNGNHNLVLRHLPIGSALSSLEFAHQQYFCPGCKGTKMQAVSFQAQGHRATKELYNYARDLLGTGNYTLKEVSEITGLGKNTVKDIDKERLLDKYTIGGKELARPEKPARMLGIDEFKLHDGYRYATHIIDMETGHILWIAAGKRKKVVYDFIEHVGMEWMGQVEAVACDMNSDFEEAFEEKCEWIQPVFDYFHIVKNFNDKVIGEVRKDEQRRLLEEGDIAGAKSLKKTRFILASSRETLRRKDEMARAGEPVRKGSGIFKTGDVKLKEGYEAKYDELIAKNKLLLTCDLVKEMLTLAYSRTAEPEMADDVARTIDICRATKNRHMLWFAGLLENHFEGIISHATYKISTGKIEGINNKIKTIRRQGYGYPDDEYFFLKIMDASRRHPTSYCSYHKKSD